jgi:hypothetical protein
MSCSGGSSTAECQGTPCVSKSILYAQLNKITHVLGATQYTKQQKYSRFKQFVQWASQYSAVSSDFIYTGFQGLNVANPLALHAHLVIPEVVGPYQVNHAGNAIGVAKNNLYMLAYHGFVRGPAGVFHVMKIGTTSIPRNNPTLEGEALVNNSVSQVLPVAYANVQTGVQGIVNAPATSGYPPQLGVREDLLGGENYLGLGGNC